MPKRGSSLDKQSMFDEIFCEKNSNKIENNSQNVPNNYINKGDCTVTLTLITYLQIVEVRHDVSHNMLVTRSDKGEVTLIQFWSLPYLERLTDVVCPLDMIGFIRLVSL